jgi:hypothetical protein
LIAVRILFDQGTPVPLRAALPAHSVATAYELGWSNLQNGELLAAAESQFDVFVTTDKSLRYQQNLAGRQLAILVLPYASWPRLSGHVPAIAAAVDAMRAGDFIELALDQT